MTKRKVDIMRMPKKNMSLLSIKREFHSTKRDTNAVSEIIATILLLSISLALLCVVYLLVLNNATGPSSTYKESSAQLLASANENNVFLQNNGGVSLLLTTKLVYTIGG